MWLRAQRHLRRVEPRSAVTSSPVYLPTSPSPSRSSSFCSDVGSDNTLMSHVLSRTRSGLRSFRPFYLSQESAVGTSQRRIHTRAQSPLPLDKVPRLSRTDGHLISAPDSSPSTLALTGSEHFALARLSIRTAAPVFPPRTEDGCTPGVLSQPGYERVSCFSGGAPQTEAGSASA